MATTVQGHTAVVDSHSQIPSVYTDSNLHYAPEDDDLSAEQFSQFTVRRTTWSNLRGSTKAAIGSISGLSLVMIAQLFFACMDVAITQLYSLNEPLPTLEVRLI